MGARLSKGGLVRIYQNIFFQYRFKTLRTGFMTVFDRKPLPGDVLGERLGERLGDNEERILTLLSEDPHLSIPMIATCPTTPHPPRATPAQEHVTSLPQARGGPCAGGSRGPMEMPAATVGA